MSAVDQETISFILNILRQGTIKWSGRSECLERARKKVHEGKFNKKGERIWKLYWQCAACKEWFRDEASMEVDHIEEIGSFLGSWDHIIPRIYCGQENLQALCQICHKKKTAIHAGLRWERKKL